MQHFLVTFFAFVGALVLIDLVASRCSNRCDDGSVVDVLIVGLALDALLD